MAAGDIAVRRGLLPIASAMTPMTHSGTVQLLGGGGHALVVGHALLSGAAGKPLRIVVRDDDPSCVAVSKGGWEYGGRLDESAATDPGAASIIAIGSIAARRSLLRRYGAARFLRLAAFMESIPDAPGASVGIGTFVGRGSVVQAFASIGAHCIINTGSIIEHECVLGENVHIAPGAVLGGNVRIGSDTLIGIGARIIPGVTIGEGCTIGAGTVVIRNVPNGSRVAGCPARVLA